MDISYVQHILQQVAEGSLAVPSALDQLKDLPYESLGYANIDEHRGLRTGQGEVIFGLGKTPAQIAGIAAHMATRNKGILITRTCPEAYAAVKEVLPGAVFLAEASCIVVGGAEVKSDKTIAVITAGTSDIPVAEEAAVTAEFFGCNVDRIFDVGVAGIHRLFDNMERLKMADVIIVAAGMEGALASVVGGLVSVPVIAVPTSIGYGASFGGVAALLAMLNSCANGIGVVNIDNGFGAAALAVKIIAGRD